MKNILSLSIHRDTLHQLSPHAPESDEVLRAILWLGPIAKHDGAIWVAEFSHPNAFVALRELRKSAQDVTDRHTVAGLCDDADCWPIDPSLASLPIQELELETHRQIAHCGGFRGLLCAVQNDGGVHRAKLFDVLPLPPSDEVAGAIINCSFWSPNIFVAAKELQVMAQASARRQKLSAVVGLDDGEPCWPENFGPRRFE